MIKFLKLEGNIAFRYGVLDTLPEDIEKVKAESKVDRLITREEFKTSYKDREYVVDEFLF